MWWAAIASACAPSAGELARPCRADGSCLDGLVCDRGVCLLSAPDAGTPDAFDADAGYDGGLDASAVDAATDAEPPFSSGPRVPAPTPNTFTLSPGFSDLALDFERHRLFLSRGLSGRVSVLDLRTGETGSFAVGHDTRTMAFDPFSDAVAIVSREPALFGGGSDAAWLDAVDAALLTVRVHATLTIDPHGVAVDASGRAYVASTGSRGNTVSLATGETTETALGLGLGSHPEIVVHPDGDRLYAGPGPDGGFLQRLSPEPHATTEYGAPEHGTWGTLRIDLDGDRLYTALGRVFRATNDRETDMRLVEEIPAWDDLAFLPSRRSALVIRDGQLFRLDTPSMVVRETLVVEGRALRVLSGPDYWVLVSLSEGGIPHMLVTVNAHD